MNLFTNCVNHLVNGTLQILQFVKRSGHRCLRSICLLIQVFKMGIQCISIFSFIHRAKRCLATVLYLLAAKALIAPKLAQQATKIPMQVPDENKTLIALLCVLIYHCPKITDIARDVSKGVHLTDFQRWLKSRKYRKFEHSPSDVAINTHSSFTEKLTPLWPLDQDILESSCMPTLYGCYTWHHTWQTRLSG